MASRAGRWAAAPFRYLWGWLADLTATWWFLICTTFATAIVFGGVVLDNNTVYGLIFGPMIVGYLVWRRLLRREVRRESRKHAVERTQVDRRARVREMFAELNPLGWVLFAIWLLLMGGIVWAVVSA